MTKYYKTYIKGFDEQLEHGIPEGHVVIVTGTAGTMKSTIAYHILYENVKKNNTIGLYILLEQSRKNFLAHLTKLNMGEILDNLHILDLALIRKNLTQFKGESWMDIFKMYIKNLKDNLNFEVLVIDSLPVLEMIAKFDNPRDELFKFFEWLKDMNITTFVISEMSMDSNRFAQHDIDFLCDGIILLKLESVSPIDVQRRIRCVKMRGVDHAPGYFTLLTKGGVFQATRTISE